MKAFFTGVALAALMVAVTLIGFDTFAVSQVERYDTGTVRHGGIEEDFDQ